MLDVKQLRYFAVVAELGSFTKASQVLRVAQPALSRQVQQLEQEVGLELFVRSGRQIRLTDAGEAMLRHARTIDRDFDRLLEDMQARKGAPKGRVIFGTPPTLAESVVPRLVRRVRRSCPLITLRIVEGLTPVLADWIRRNETDLAILSMPLGWARDELPGIVTEVIGTEDMVVAERAHGPVAAGPCGIDELAGKEMVLSDMLAAIVRRQLHKPGFEFRAALEIDSVQAMKAMVLRGDAATILPVSMLKEEIESGLVRARAITEQSIQRQLILAQPAFRQMTQAAETMRALIRKEARLMAAEGVFSLRAPA